MVAFAMHLLRTLPDLKHVAIHPDCMHGKMFDFAAWLQRQRYELTKPRGTTSYDGLYASADGRTLEVYPKPGLGDVVGGNITAECKVEFSTRSTLARRPGSVKASTRPPVSR